MQPEQQRTIDALIAAGKLEAAADAYRAATGTALIGAKMYVYDRAAALGTSAPQTPAPSATPQPARVSGIADPRRDRKPAAQKVRKVRFSKIVFVVVALTVLLTVARAAYDTKLFGAYTITNEPYYGELTRAIENQRTFRQQLGAPIAVDARGVWCRQVSSDGGFESSTCRLPVSGSRARASDGAYVAARSAIDGRSVRFALVLHAHNALFRASYRRRKAPFRKAARTPRVNLQTFKR